LIALIPEKNQQAISSGSEQTCKNEHRQQAANDYSADMSHAKSEKNIELQATHWH